jgi:hypothetical protein
MEPLWSRVVATGRNHWQIDWAQNRRSKRKPLPRLATSCLSERMASAAGCHQLQEVPLPAREEVDGLRHSSARGYFLLQSGHGIGRGHSRCMPRGS